MQMNKYPSSHIVCFALGALFLFIHFFCVCVALMLAVYVPWCQTASSFALFLGDRKLFPIFSPLFQLVCTFHQHALEERRREQKTENCNGDE